MCDQLALELNGWEELNLVIDNSTLPRTYEAQRRVIAYVIYSKSYLVKKLGIPVLLGPIASELMLGQFVGQQRHKDLV